MPQPAIKREPSSEPALADIPLKQNKALATPHAVSLPVKQRGEPAQRSATKLPSWPESSKGPSSAYVQPSSHTRKPMSCRNVATILPAAAKYYEPSPHEVRFGGASDSSNVHALPRASLLSSRPNPALATRRQQTENPHTTKPHIGFLVRNNIAGLHRILAPCLHTSKPTTTIRPANMQTYDLGEGNVIDAEELNLGSLEDLEAMQGMCFV